MRFNQRVPWRTAAFALALPLGVESPPLAEVPEYPEAESRGTNLTVRGGLSSFAVIAHGCSTDRTLGEIHTRDVGFAFEHHAGGPVYSGGTGGVVRRNSFGRRGSRVAVVPDRRNRALCQPAPRPGVRQHGPWNRIDCQLRPLVGSLRQATRIPHIGSCSLGRPTQSTWGSPRSRASLCTAMVATTRSGRGFQLGNPLICTLAFPVDRMTNPESC